MNTKMNWQELEVQTVSLSLPLSPDYSAISIQRAQHDEREPHLSVCLKYPVSSPARRRHGDFPRL
ncbi:hypothetical protein D3C75_1149460 [compost metagenome]